EGGAESLLPPQALADRPGELVRGGATESPEVERGSERGEPALLDRVVGAGDARAVARGQDPRHRGAPPLVDGHDRPAEVLVVREVAAREAEQLDGRYEAVADAEGVRLDVLLGAGDRAPVGVDRRVDDPLDAPVALGADDDPAIAHRHAGPKQLQAV